MLDKHDRKEALKFIDEGMIFSQKIMDEAESAKERLFGQLLFRLYYLMKLIYKEV